MRIKKDFVKTDAIGDSFVVVPVGEESGRTHLVITLNETARGTNFLIQRKMIGGRI